VIDPGDSKPIIELLESNSKYLKGILITHSHFDHIYGINDLCEIYPDANIYASIQAKKGLLSAKLNRSYYAEIPFVVRSNNIITVQNNDNIPIFENMNALVIDTPGHNNDCLTFTINKHLFTGDALIPGIKIHTKSKFGDKIQARISIDKIVHSFCPDSLICPGHGDICYLKDIDIINTTD